MRLRALIEEREAAHASALQVAREAFAGFAAVAVAGDQRAAPALWERFEEARAKVERLDCELWAISEELNAAESDGLKVVRRPAPAGLERFIVP